MKNKLKKISFLLLLLYVTTIAHAIVGEDDEGPWFTGTLLSIDADTVDKGHRDYEPYVFFTDNLGFYNRRSHAVHRNESQKIDTVMEFWQGLTDYVDVEVAIPYTANFAENQKSSAFGDISTTFGIQLFKDDPNTERPNIMFQIGQLFPAGRYQNLDPIKLGTDNTGTGAFQTLLGLNYGKLRHIYGQHYLNTRLNLNYSISAPVRVHNFNAFGGGFGTNAKARQGDVFSLDLSYEYNLSRHWATAMDALYLVDQRTKFKGFPGFDEDGQLAELSQPSGDQLSLAPAIEYNFNANMGLIVGPWFSVTGRESDQFMSVVIAFNIYT